MRTETWTQMQLELAAEAILAELEGRERRLWQERHLSERPDAQSLLRVIAAAAAYAAEKGREAESESEETVYVESAGESETAESAVRGSVQRADAETSLAVRRQNAAAEPAVMATTPEAEAPQKPVGGTQALLHTISDWIERESRRYDSGFTIF